MLVDPNCRTPRRDSHQRLHKLQASARQNPKCNRAGLASRNSQAMHRFSHPQRLQVPIATQGFGDWKSLAPVIIAMNVVLPFLSIGILIWLLKSAE